RVRSGFDKCGVGCDQHTCDCVGWRRRSTGSGRWHHAGPCRRGTGFQHLPLWRAYGAGGEALHGSSGHTDEVGMSSNAKWLSKVRWDDQGLVPVIAQEVGSNDVLMFAWMNRDALAKTVEIGEAVYWSRSRRKLWHKGEESGHTQK